MVLSPKQDTGALGRRAGQWGGCRAGKDSESSYDENCFEELHVEEDSEVLSVEMNAKGLQYLEGF